MTNVIVSPHVASACDTVHVAVSEEFLAQLGPTIDAASGVEPSLVS